MVAAAAEPEQETENACRSYTYRYYDHSWKMWRYRTRYHCTADDEETELWNKQAFRTAWKKELKLVDKDGDHKLSKAEVRAWAKANPKESGGVAKTMKAFPMVDTDKDGFIERKEYKKFYKGFLEKMEKAKTAK